MKTKIFGWMLVAAVGGAFVSCKKKEEQTGADKEATVVEKVAEAIEETVAKLDPAKLTAEERAAKLGFARHLPADTEYVMSFYNGEQSVEQLRALKMWGVIEEMVNASPGFGGADFEMDDIDEDMIEEEMEEAEQEQLAEEDMELMEEDEMAGPPGPGVLLGREVTVALGASGGEQTGNLLRLNRRYAYYQSKMLATMVLEAAKSGDEDAFADLNFGEVFKDLVTDPESGTALLDRTVMPPLYVAFRAKEGQLEEAAQLIAGSMAFFGMAGEMAQPVEFETGGATLSGFKLLGEKIAESAAESRSSMEEDLGAEATDALLAAIAKKNLVVVSGTIGDYVVLGISGAEESLKLIAEPKDSLAAADRLRFVDDYADKPLVAMIHGEKELWDTLIAEAGGLADYALGFRAGLAGGEGLGDTRDIESMLQIVADREAALVKLGGSESLGMIAFLEEGLKIESFGGYDDGAIDWKSDRVLSHLNDSGENLLFFNSATNPGYDEKMGDYIEAILETAYAITMKVSEVSIDSPDFDQAKGFAKLFEEQFRDDVVAIWTALSGDLADGLGSESALVIDLKGSLPAVPGLPQAVVDQGKAPRMTLVSPVEDRAKLVASWEKLNTTTTSLLAKFSELSGTKIPMQKPINSDKDGFTTWFFPFPFFDNDFLPSVTVGDKWFAASTSKTHALDLLAKAEAGGEKRKGLVFSLSFSALQAYADETLKLVEANKVAIFGDDEFALESFEENKVQLAKLIDALDEFDALHMDARREGGQLRWSTHFKTK